MATQQGAPSRPWLRLATMVRPPPPPIQQQQLDQASAPPPRPATFIRPAFTTRTSPVVAPPPNVVAPTSPPVARAPTIPKEQPPPSAATATSSRADSPSMKAPTTRSSPPSTISRPPSPLVLPSPQVKSYDQQPEYEQKTVLVQETKEKPKDDVGWRSHHNPNAHETSAKKHSVSSEEIRTRIITIAGENKGAIMDLTPKTIDNKFAGNIKKKDINIPTTTPNPLSGDHVDKSSGSNSDGSWSKAKKKNNQKSKSSPLMSAVMNSNVQGVNNSILYNCSTTHHDPGVHLSLKRNKPAADIDARGF